MKEEAFPKKFINIITKLDFMSNDEPEEYEIQLKYFLLKIKFQILLNSLIHLKQMKNGDMILGMIIKKRNRIESRS